MSCPELPSGRLLRLAPCKFTILLPVRIASICEAAKDLQALAVPVPKAATMVVRGTTTPAYRVPAQ